MTDPHPAASWPIATCLHGIPTSLPDGTALHDAPDGAWARVARRIASTGFDHAELADSHARIGDMDASQRAALRATFAEEGITVASVHVQRRSVIQPEHGAENLAYAHRTIDAAADWGMQVVSTGLHQPFTAEQRRALWFWTAPGATDPDDPDTWDLAVRRLRDLGRHAAELGLLLSLEMYEDTYLGTAASAVRLVEEIDLPNVGLNPDIGNLVRLHRPIEDWRAAYRATLPYANYWHLKNYTRDEGDGVVTSSPTSMELGIIDYRQVITEAVEGGYRGILLMEQYGGDSLGVCATNREYVRGILSQVVSELERDAHAEHGSRDG